MQGKFENLKSRNSKYENILATIGNTPVVRLNKLAPPHGEGGELANKHGWFLCRQFDNEANADMHSRTAAPEILGAFEGDLDSTAYQRDDRGGQIRAVLRTRTGSKTIPQVFVGGEFIGGCTDTLEMFKDGRLQRLLNQHDVHFDESVRVDPYTLLPGWLHPR